MASKLHKKKLLLELLLLRLDAVEVFEYLLCLTIISNIKNKIDLLLSKLLVTISFALNINQSLDEFVFLHFSLNNLDISFCFNNFNR